MAQELFDVWLVALQGAPHAPAADALARVFGIESVLAQQLVSAVPCVVKRRLALHDAQTMAGALAAIGGRVELRAHAPKPGHVALAAPEDSGQTLKVGTLETGSVGFVPTLRPPVAPAAAVRVAAISPSVFSIPAPAAVSAPRPYSQRPPPSAAEVRAAFMALPEVPGAVGRHAPIALEPSAESLSLDETGASSMSDPWRQALMLPESTRPPAAASAMRDPAQRERPPRLHPTVPPAAAGRLSSEKLLDPLHVTVGILRHAKGSSLQNALAGHPLAGFLLVLGATTLAFLALYVVT